MQVQEHGGAERSRVSATTYADYGNNAFGRPPPKGVSSNWQWKRPLCDSQPSAGVQDDGQYGG